MKNNKKNTFHSTCFACGSENEHGLQLKFKVSPNGSTCNIAIPHHFQSYEGVVHGGIVATILDAAMIHNLRTNCRKNPLTCRLEIRYLRALRLGEPLTVIARMTGKRGRIVLAHAELMCSDKCFARARGAFTFR